jgi:hypothetical protein
MPCLAGSVVEPAGSPCFMAVQLTPPDDRAMAFAFSENGSIFAFILQHKRHMTMIRHLHVL